MEWVIWGALLLTISFGFTVFFGAPYVPVRIKHLRLAFDELYQLKESDLLLDLGSGDGKVLREVARRGASAVGYELNPLLVLISACLGLKVPHQHTQLANIWTSPFPQDTTIVYIFSDSRDIRRMERRIRHESQRLGRSLYVLSYGFTLPGFDVIGEAGVHTLYKTRALQTKKPQV